MEHHANFIPWQMLAKKYQIELRIVPMNKDGDLDLTELKSLIDHKTQLLAVSHISNTIGTIHPLDEITGLAKNKKIPILIDAAQSACHFEIGVDSLNCDFITFSGHKMFGPFGVGILQVSEKYLGDMTPFNLGGGIIKDVQIGETNFLNFPHNLDAGTPNVSGIIGLAAALKLISDFLEENGSTGVQKCLEKAVLDKLDLIAIYPVEDETHFTDGQQRVLPDAFLLPRGSTALDLAYKVHTDIGDSFIRAIDCNSKRVIGRDHELSDGDIIKIVAGS